MRKWYLKCIGCNMYFILTEIWRDDKGILVERDGDKHRYYISNEELSEKYVEYKEPRKLERWINVYLKNGELKDGGIMHKTEALAKECNIGAIATIKISYTEGE